MLRKYLIIAMVLILSACGQTGSLGTDQHGVQDEAGAVLGAEDCAQALAEAAQQLTYFVAQRGPGG